MEQREEPTPLTRHVISAGLRELGLGQGDVVEVHSSLRSFGKVEGGASTIVNALMEVVGPEGAIIMSAYPLSLPVPLTAEERARGLAWKVRRLDEDSHERTGMGAIVDEFRRRPGVKCGSGLHRVCAWGRQAELHCQLGYAALLESDGWALLAGVGIDRLSSMHQAESRVGLPAEVERCFAIPEELRRDYPAPEWEIGCGGTPEDAWGKVWQEALHRQLVRQQRIGQAECKLFKARAVEGIYEDWLRSDPLGLFGLR